MVIISRNSLCETINWAFIVINFTTFYLRVVALQLMTISAKLCNGVAHVKIII